MRDTNEILNFIDTFLTTHADWLPNVTVDFALDLRSMVEQSVEPELEVAA